MKRLVFIVIAMLFFSYSNAQQTYTVNGESLELKTEIDGTLDLLWNIIDGQYRYFVRSEDGTITELKNTRGEDRKYLEEYKSVLASLTNNSISTEKLKLTLYDLRNFIDDYNSSKDSSYQSVTTKSDVLVRLGINAGITNNPFVENPNNDIAPLGVLELEVMERNVLQRHSGFLQVRHSFENGEFNYSTTELSLGYRYRIVNKETFSIYGQLKFATVNFSRAEVEVPQGPTTVTNEAKDTAFDAPMIFGVGAEIAVGDSGFITINYGELFAVFLDNQGNFSTDITLGYKFNL
ncbi:hypothetical protein [Winogradskyella sp. 3972H.M.0a.05]|uniref:hypothetical protein n=1 Tax=Winogradskyella sp. 3972H.M.0a.05 TaxID=2950277 RepID=UPI0033984F63